MSGYMDFEANDFTGQPDNLNALTIKLDSKGKIKPPGRCVDCKWVDIRIENHLATETFKDFVRAECIHSELLHSQILAEDEEILPFLRQPCSFTLPDGSYGFEPVEVEE